MRGMHWSPEGGLRCGDCGGYEIDLLEDGRARCRTCGRSSVPVRVRRSAGLGRMMFWIFAMFLVVLAVEAIVSWLYATASASSPLRTFSLLAFITGAAALAIAGVGATPGRVSMKTQRLDRLGRLYPLQDPQAVGTMTPGAKEVPTEEPGATGLFLLAGLGAVLIVLGYVFNFL